MKKYLLVLTLCGVLTGSVMLAEVKAQALKHEEHKDEKALPAKKAAEAEKTDGIKCCEGMEKMGEMKAGMPMKTEMKVKMMEKMKEKMAEKMGEKGTKTQTKDSKVEKDQSTKDGHQH